MKDVGVVGRDDGEPDWYRTAVIYQVHVRSFCDGNVDGIGDFRGLTEKLDHIQDLGASAVWLLPFYPSPLRDGGYDIANYTEVNPEYGTLRDFKRFVEEAHRRGLRVITEIVINHTSDQHIWFQRSRRAKPGSKWRNFYVWNDTDDKYPDARIIFSDFESSNWTWDAVAGAYFWHRFYSHQPDLNFDNPDVHAEVFRIVDFWLGLGVDGLRLDAVPYLYERAGTTCENLPETHEFLRRLRAHVDENFEDRMLLAEANQWPEDTRAYFGDGDECHMAFNFPVMPRMYMAVQMEDRYPLVDILQQTPDIPSGAQWALFLRNHDELTLEMVTDEERDYMYRVYAADQRARINLGIRRRLAPLLHNDRPRIELLNGLLMSLPGTPIVYYGDEIGMGDNIYLGDRDGVRTPMQWSADRNAGFSTANPQQLFLPVNIDPEYRFESVNVAAQRQNPSSLLMWMRRMVAMRQQYPVFGTGSIEFLFPDNSKVLCFLRSDATTTVLVIANLSRFSQFVELSLSAHQGKRPVELFGRTEFPRIGELPYLLTLGPHAFYWFELQPARAHAAGGEQDLPTVTTSSPWATVFEHPRSRAAVEAALPAVLARRRWYGGKSRRITTVAISHVVDVPLGTVRDNARVLLVDVSFSEGEGHRYVMPVTYLPTQIAESFQHNHPGSGLLRFRPRGERGMDGVLCEAMAEEHFTRRLLAAVTQRKRLRDTNVEIRGIATRELKSVQAAHADQRLWPTLHSGEQSNTSVFYSDAMVLKLFRRLDTGLNPDWELGRFLTEKGRFGHTPKMLGALELRDDDGQTATVAVLQEVVPNDGDAWSHFKYDLSGYFEQMPVTGMHRRRDQLPADEHLEPMLAQVELLAVRTGQMHLALASDTTNPAMRPEPFTPHYRRSLYQSIRSQVIQAIGVLRRQRSNLPPAAREPAAEVLAAESSIVGLLSEIKDLEIEGLRMRIHGDYHLGQVLFTGRDFMILDFEGEPGHSMSVRRLKRSPLRDVAGMLRSLDYVAYVACQEHCDRFNLRAGARLRALRAAQYWAGIAGTRFLGAYLQEVQDALLDEDSQSTATLLRAFLLEKACYELEYELNNRPAWVEVPLRGLAALVP